MSFYFAVPVRLVLRARELDTLALAAFADFLYTFAFLTRAAFGLLSRFVVRISFLGGMFFFVESSSRDAKVALFSFCIQYVY